MIKSHTFRGKAWRIRWHKPGANLDGMAQHEGGKFKRISIDPDLSGRDRLETLIHEALHAADWSKDEDFTDTDARDLARFLWRDGWRRESSQPSLTSDSSSG
jgi:hypothetical protein